jgi:hypothetical protein
LGDGAIQFKDVALKLGETHGSHRSVEALRITLNEHRAKLQNSIPDDTPLLIPIKYQELSHISTNKLKRLTARADGHEAARRDVMRGTQLMMRSDYQNDASN